MTKKIQYCTVILSDSLYCKVVKIKENLSKLDGKDWSMSNTVNLLLHYCYRENPENDTLDLFLDCCLYGKISFLKEFRIAIEKSAVFE